MKPYVEHEGKVVETDGHFSHVMAIALDPLSSYKRGLIRCITSREGNVEEKGYVDRSELHLISGELEHFTIGEQLEIKNKNEIVEQLKSAGLDYLGLEDPDIWVDETGLMHVYFTMPFIHRKVESASRIHLGHAVGKDLNSLVMTLPALTADASGKNNAKEVSIAPASSSGVRYNLFESSDLKDEVYYSTVRIGIANRMDEAWQFGEIVFHPAERAIPWIGGHASPGPLLPKSFIDIGTNKMLGLMNGREANKKVGDKTVYGMFSVGLFIYDYENGKIDWVSNEPFIQDSRATTITFASQFVETKPGEGILYAHVDDSFVRAYTLSTDTIKTLLP